jgi:hypothetical protein
LKIQFRPYALLSRRFTVNEEVYVVKKENAKMLQEAFAKQARSIDEIDKFLDTRPSRIIRRPDPRHGEIERTMGLLRQSLERALSEVEHQLHKEISGPGCGTEDDELWPIRNVKEGLEYVENILRSLVASERNLAHDISMVLKATHFAAEKHKTQRRKGADASPYINHPLKVAEILFGFAVPAHKGVFFRAECPYPSYFLEASCPHAGSLIRAFED